MRLTWEIIIAILAVLMSVFLMWFMFNDSAVVVAKGGSEALYGTGGRSGGAGGGAGFSGTGYSDIFIENEITKHLLNIVN